MTKTIINQSLREVSFEDHLGGKRRSDQCEVAGCGNDAYALVLWQGINPFDPGFVKRFNKGTEEEQKFTLELNRRNEASHQLSPCEKHYEPVINGLKTLGIETETQDIYGRVKG